MNDWKYLGDGDGRQHLVRGGQPACGAQVKRGVFAGTLTLAKPHGTTGGVCKKCRRLAS